MFAVKYPGHSTDILERCFSDWTDASLIGNFLQEHITEKNNKWLESKGIHSVSDGILHIRYEADLLNKQL